ncbi:MAG: hypothetical protein WA323_28380 [Candidatus Nitrosopolaris sp.]
MKQHPPTKNLIPMIVKPSPSSLIEMTLLPIQIQIMPNATTIIPAAKSGLSRADNSLADFDITVQHRM